MVEKVLIGFRFFWQEKESKNKWNCDDYTQFEAEKRSKTLIDCNNCTDCYMMTDCNDCEGCEFCEYCDNCYKCRMCTDKNYGNYLNRELVYRI